MLGIKLSFEYRKETSRFVLRGKVRKIKTGKGLELGVRIGIWIGKVQVQEYGGMMEGGKARWKRVGLQ